MSQHDVTLLLGSNLGEVENNIKIALDRISIDMGVIIKKSSLILTAPVEFVSCNIFCNIAVLIKTQFSPLNLLKLIKKIETDLGRREDSGLAKVYSDRIIDIDIVEYGNIKFECEILNIPHHKHLYERDFSKILLMEIKTQ